MPRPELPKLNRGDTVVVRDRFDASTSTVTEMVVVGLGPKYVHLCRPDVAEDPVRAKWMTRKFLRRDQREGEPGKRVGYGASFATAEQHEWDVHVRRASMFLRNVVGVDVRHGGPLSDPDRMAEFVALIHASGMFAEPEAGAS